MNSRQAFDWNDEAVATLTRMWEEGSSGSLIAKAIGNGVSRNAVLGKLSRLKLLRTRSTTTNKLAYKRARSARGGATALAEARQRTRETWGMPKAKKAPHTGGSRRAAAIQRRVEVETPPPVIFDATLAKPWLERKFGECAYPISGDGADTISCCQPASGTAYCAAHQRIMFDRRPQTIAKGKSLHRWAGKVA